MTKKKQVSEPKLKFYQVAIKGVATVAARSAEEATAVVEDWVTQAGIEESEAQEDAYLCLDVDGRASVMNYSGPMRIRDLTTACGDTILFPE